MLEQTRQAEIATLSIERSIPGSGAVWVNLSSRARCPQPLADTHAAQMHDRGEHEAVSCRPAEPTAYSAKDSELRLGRPLTIVTKPDLAKYAGK